MGLISSLLSSYTYIAHQHLCLQMQIIIIIMYYLYCFFLNQQHIPKWTLEDPHNKTHNVQSHWDVLRGSPKKWVLLPWKWPNLKRERSPYNLLPLKTLEMRKGCQVGPCPWAIVLIRAVTATACVSSPKVYWRKWGVQSIRENSQKVMAVLYPYDKIEIVVLRGCLWNDGRSSPSHLSFSLWQNRWIIWWVLSVTKGSC